MKKFAKICAVIAGILAVIGLGLLLASVALGARFSTLRSAFENDFFTIEGRGLDLINPDDDYDDYDSDDYDDIDDENYDDDDDYNEHDDYDDDNHDSSQQANAASAVNGTYADIKNIQVDMKAGAIVFEKTTEKELTVENNEQTNHDGHTQIRQDSQTLYVENDFPIHGNYHGEIRVLIPEGMTFSEVEIQIGVGEVTMGDFTADNLEVNVGGGQFQSSGTITARESSWEVGAGEIRTGALISDDVSFECGVGSIQAALGGSKKDYNYDIECGVGTIQLGDQKFSSLSNEASQETAGITKEIEANCGLGEITITFEQ